MGCGDFDEWLAKQGNNGLSEHEGLRHFGPGWWDTLSRIWTLVGDHNWEVIHGRAEGAAKIIAAYRLEGLPVVRIDPLTHPLWINAVEIMSECMDLCETCGCEAPLWWGGDEDPGGKINGEKRILCEECWEQAKTKEMNELFGRGAHVPARRTPAPVPETLPFDDEPWFPGKDERDAVEDGDEPENWQIENDDLPF